MPSICWSEMGLSPYQAEHTAVSLQQDIRREQGKDKKALKKNDNQANNMAYV